MSADTNERVSRIEYVVNGLRESLSNEMEVLEGTIAEWFAAIRREIQHLQPGSIEAEIERAVKDAVDMERTACVLIAKHAFAAAPPGGTWEDCAQFIGEQIDARRGT